ncbi:MAG: tripartite tricarboxylate transporter TctB family protein [Sneathiella sp.]
MQEARTSTIVASVLLIFCAVMIGASYDIRDLGFDGLPATSWPRFILILLALVSTVHFIQSVIRWRKTAISPVKNKQELPTPSFQSRMSKYQNPLWCFGLFGLFLGTLDYFGMLIGGILFTFLLLSVLGGWSRKNLLMHTVLSVTSIGIMWSIFTFGLRVFLPQGEILGNW